MMSHEEQLEHDERAVTISRLRFNLSLWQIISLVGGVATAVTFFFHYDNGNKDTYATKKDVTELIVKVDRLNDKMGEIVDVIKDNHYRDSTSIAEIKATVILNKQNSDSELAYIRKQCEKLGFVTERWDASHKKLSLSTEN